MLIGSLYVNRALRKSVNIIHRKLNNGMIFLKLYKCDKIALPKKCKMKNVLCFFKMTKEILFCIKVWNLKSLVFQKQEKCFM